MAQAVDGIASAVEQLSERVRELERRVAALEEQPQGASYPRLTGTEIQEQRVAGPARGFPLTDLSSGAVPILGKAILGIAGAYLLRAIAESGALPSRVVFTLGTLYAVAWLLWAARNPVGRRFATTLYSLTAVLILSPLLWEATLRFQTITTWGPVRSSWPSPRSAWPYHGAGTCA